jgi:1,4-alpha-glucan branching enzyme
VPDAGTPPGTPPFGATVQNGGVAFRVWAPHATAAAVVGTFPGGTAAMTAVGDGTFSAVVPGAKAGDTYHYSLTANGAAIDRLDPWCRERDGTECRVVDPSAYAWQAGAFQRPAREQAVVYELHVGSFAVDAGAAQGTFASLQASLGGLADLGASVIELMPVEDFGGKNNGWGYNPQLYLAPQPGYGAADDFRALVDAAHQQGIGVWLDVVYNHYDGGSQAPLHCFDGDCPSGAAGIYFFAPGPWATTPWGPRPDYTDPQVVGLISGSISAWLTEMRVDGFRWDSVSNIRGNNGQGTTPGGRDLLVQGNALAHKLGATSVAEDLKGYAAITQPASAGGFDFDAQWDGFGYTVDGVLTATSDDARDLGAVQSALQGTYAGDPFARLIWVEDHDTVGNGGAHLPSLIDPASPESFAARKRSMLGGVLLLTAPGVPMLFQGQDILATGTLANPPAPLAPPTTAGLAMRAFYKDMIRLRKNLDGGSGSLADPQVAILHRNDTAKVIAYRRYGNTNEDVIVIANLRNKAYAAYDIGVPSGGAWKVRLDTDWTAYGADFGGGETGTLQAVAMPYGGQPYKLTTALGAYSAVVLSR